MKINLGKLLRVIGRVIVAAPIITEAAKPVFVKRKKLKGNGPKDTSLPQPVPARRSGEVER